MKEQQRRGESKAQQGTNKRLFKVFVADIEWYRYRYYNKTMLEDCNKKRREESF